MPPLDVLKKIFLKYDYVIEPARLYQVTEEKFNAWQKQMQDDYDTRQDLLAGVDTTPSSPPFVNKLEPIDDFCASLIPDGKFQVSHKVTVTERRTCTISPIIGIILD